MFNMFKTIKEKFMGKTPEKEHCEHDVGKSMKNALNKRFDREARGAQRIAEMYDVDSLSESEYRTLFRKESDKILEEDKAEDTRKKALLKNIPTLRTEEEIADAIKAGKKVLKQEVIASKSIHVTDLHIKDKQTGEIIVKVYNYHAIPRDYDRYEIVEKRTYYPYEFPSKIAAYLLPDDLEVGERVVLQDLIEDIVGESHAWGTYRLNSGEAVWNGENFVVDCKSYDVRVTMG